MATDPFYGLTGKRQRVGQADIIAAEAPEKRNEFYAQRQRELQEKEAAENARRFRENMQYQEDVADQQEQQENISSGISGAGTLLSATQMGLPGWAAAAGAIIAGQRALTNSMDREYKGVRSGDVFSTGDPGTEREGNWEPRFFTEPWQAYASKDNDRPSSGERFDSAMINIQRGGDDWTPLLTESPGVENQWTNPLMAPVHEKAFQDTKDITGSEDAARVVSTLLDPAAGLGDAISDIGDDSYLCTEIVKKIGIGKDESINLKTFRKFLSENPTKVFEFYLKHAPNLVRIINSKEGPAFWESLKNTLLTPTMKFVNDSKCFEAFVYYVSEGIKLFRLYTPELNAELDAALAEDAQCQAVS